MSSAESLEFVAVLTAQPPLEHFAAYNNVSRYLDCQGKILPANPFALAELPASAPGSAVAGIFAAHVVVVDATTGSVIAGTLGGWSCNAANPPTQFDGSFSLERLPVGRSYQIYAEPILGLVGPGDFSDALDNLCSTTAAPTCTTPNVNTSFNVRILPSGP